MLHFRVKPLVSKDFRRTYASHLNLSTRTIETHVALALERLPYKKRSGRACDVSGITGPQRLPSNTSPAGKPTGSDFRGAHPAADNSSRLCFQFATAAWRSSFSRSPQLLREADIVWSFLQDLLHLEFALQDYRGIREGSREDDADLLEECPGYRYRRFRHQG